MNPSKAAHLRRSAYMGAKTEHTPLRAYVYATIGDERARGEKVVYNKRKVVLTDGL